MQASCLHVALDQIVEPRLVDGNVAVSKVCNLFLVDVDTGHVDANLGEACARNKTYISRTNNRYIHFISFFTVLPIKRNANTLFFPIAQLAPSAARMMKKAKNADTITDGINVSPSIRIGS